MSYKCPICGYDKLKNPIYDKDGYGTFEICVCCGFEFGCDDFPNKEIAYLNWREKWKNQGYQWFSTFTKKPKNWNPTEQLKNLETQNEKN